MEQFFASQWLGDDLLDPEHLSSSAIGANAGAELAGDRDEGSARVSCSHLTHEPRACMFRHVHAHDHESRRIPTLYYARCCPDAIAGFSEPLPKELAHEVVFLVYHNV